MDALGNDFVKQWTLNTFYGWLIGFAFILVLAMGLEALGLSGQFFIGTGMGAGVGWMQWRIGKRTIDLDKRWIWASTIGMTIPFLILDYGPMFVAEEFRLPTGVLAGSVLTGILQAYLIRKKSRKAWWWFFICIIAWVTAPLLIRLSEETSIVFGQTYVSGFITLLLILAGGLSIGWVGALGLRRIL